MVMEAMRLSLLEHEQQQQRQREEEERNRRNGETSERGRSTEPGNNTGLNTPSSSQRSASVVPPQPVGEAIDHRPSSLPTNNPLDGLYANGDWRRNRSQLSTLAAAVNAANTASVVLSVEEPRPPPLSSSSTQTRETGGDTTTISSNSSGTGHSSTRPTPVIDAVDGDEEGEVNYTALPSSPESLDQSHSYLARTEGDEMVAWTRSRTPE